MSLRILPARGIDSYKIKILVKSYKYTSAPNYTFISVSGSAIDNQTQSLYYTFDQFFVLQLKFLSYKIVADHLSLLNAAEIISLSQNAKSLPPPSQPQQKTSPSHAYSSKKKKNNNQNNNQRSFTYYPQNDQNKTPENTTPQNTTPQNVPPPTNAQENVPPSTTYSQNSYKPKTPSKRNQQQKKTPQDFIYRPSEDQPKE